MNTGHETAMANHTDAVNKNAAASAETKKLESRTFYSNIAGSTFVFVDGTVARFEHGEYVTDREFEIAQLEALCKLPSNHQVYTKKVPVHNISDAIVAKEVGRGPNSGTGMLNSAALADLAAQMGRK